MYWVEEAAGLVVRANLDGTNPTTLVSGQNYPSGLAFDRVAGKLYWSSLSGTISRANVDGTGVTQIFSGGGCFYGLALMPTTSCTGLNVSTQSSAPTWMVAPSRRSGRRPVALEWAVDSVASKVYWGNCNGPMVVANLDGSNPTSLFPNIGCPTQFTLSREYLAGNMTASLAVDADNDGVPLPGDTIMYQTTIMNAGNGDTANLAFSDTPDANTTLVVGSVQTTQGTVTTGNTAGNTTIGVNLGVLDGDGGSATGITAFGSNDPDTQAANDATVTIATSAPLLAGSKTVTLAIDADTNGTPSPGDTLQYQVTVTNSGNIGTTSAALSDTPDANTTLVVGSVQTSQGSITSGNTAGDNNLAVSIGTLNGGGANVTITFRVLVRRRCQQA